MEIRLSRSVLRPFREGDEVSLIQHANDRRVSRTLRDRFPYPYTDCDADAWIGVASREKPFQNLAITVDDQVVGGIGVIPGEDVYRRGGEIGYWLGHACWGRGILSEALPPFADYAASTYALVRLWAGVYEGNLASARVLEKAGFVREATMRSAIFKDGVLLDYWLYARVRA